jgi:hypothetical protein
MRAIDEVLNVDDETARMLVDLGVATAVGLSPQTGSSAALFADTFLQKSVNLGDVVSVSASRGNLSVPSTSDVTSEIAAYATPKAVEWDSTTNYTFGNIVLHQDATFVCTQANSNRVPFAEQNYWQILSSGWSWMNNPYGATLAFGNARTLGTGTADNGSSLAIQYVRVNLNTTTTSGNARAIYRTLSIGVPAYPHRYFDPNGTDGGSFNTINFRSVGKFQSAFFLSLRNTAETAGTVFYIDVGRTYSEVSGSGTISPVDAPLDKRGFGLRFVANGGGGLSNAYATYHDGTTYFETAFDTSLIKYAGGINRLDINWDGRGGMIWFINGIEVHRIDNIPVDTAGIYSIPTWGAIAVGAYNAPNVDNADQMIWVVPNETGFITGSG